MRLSMSVHVHGGVSHDNDPDVAAIKIQNMCGIWVELWGTCKNNVLGCISQVQPRLMKRNTPHSIIFAPFATHTSPAAFSGRRSL